MSVDQEAGSQLFGQGGFLGPDQAPRVHAMSEGANVKFLQAMESRCGSTLKENEKAKKRRTEMDDAKKAEEEKKKKEAEEERLRAVAADPKLAASEALKALRKRVADFQKECLGQSNGAKSYVLKLENHDLSDKLITQFEGHQKLMDGAFHSLACNQPPADESCS
jgi:hypothetical protein